MTQNQPVLPQPAGLGGGILVGIDFSSNGLRALVTARSLARERNGRLFVLHVVDCHGLDEVARLTERPEKHLRELLGRERRERLASLMREIEDGGSEVPAQLIIAWGHPFEEIGKKAEDLVADLIVLGTSGRSADLERALFGSTAEKVLRSTSRPLLCVPAE